MKEIRGNLIQLAKDGQFDVIVHGCNCFNTMGSGIAKQIREEFPDAWETDQRTFKGDYKKLGSVSYAFVNLPNNHLLYIINAYTQYHYLPRNQRHVEYSAVRDCMRVIAKLMHGRRIGLPLIGAGLAGGDWNIISKIIAEELDGEDYTIVHYDK